MAKNKKHFVEHAEEILDDPEVLEEGDATDEIIVDEETEETEETDLNGFTYVGKGATPPAVIMFMGQEEFVRGEYKIVTNPDVLAKIRNNPCFVNRRVTQKELFEADKDASQKERLQRSKDAELTSSVQRKIAKYAAGDE